MSTKATTREEAEQELRSASEQLERDGYRLQKNEWTPGAWTSGDFLMALLACLFLVGILIFIYMAVVKPKGTLFRTYDRGLAESEPSPSMGMKTCPSCAEEVKAAAAICRYCRHTF